MNTHHIDEFEPVCFDMFIRGEIPSALCGSLIIPSSRRHKDRKRFSRWHDSQTDLLRLDLYPGRPGRICVHVLEVNSAQVDFQDSTIHRLDQPIGTPTPLQHAHQPNHGVNIANDTVWATNLLFGAPVEVDLRTWKPRRILQYLELNELAPRVSNTSHFAWSLDGKHAYFHQSLLQQDTPESIVHAADLCLIELDIQRGSERTWSIIPPPEDAALESANFHSGFYFEEDGKKFVGLLRTGAIVESLVPHGSPMDHAVVPMPVSTIWIVELDSNQQSLQAYVMPEIAALDGLALSHLDVDATGGDGFILYANFKESDVAEETHGINIYGEPPEHVTEQYSGMIVEAINYGMVIRCERRHGKTSLKKFSRPYAPGRTSHGHTWLPVNIELDSSGKRLFCTFSGFRPRLLPRHIADAYQGRVVEPESSRYVPPLLMRLNADTLEPDYDKNRGHLSYAEPVAMAVVGDGQSDYVCTFSPDTGLRIYLADDLSRMICHAESSRLLHWQDDYFRTEPAHMQFVHR